MAGFVLPDNAVLVVFATDIETTGELATIDALMAIGVSVVALLDDGMGPVVVLKRRFGGWRVGSKRFSLRCVEEYLTKANDESDDPSGWEERRKASKANGYADLHTYPRVAPFAYDGGVCEHNDRDRSSFGCEACCGEIATEHKAYADWLALRREVVSVCADRNIPFKQATDNGGFDHGWLMALATVAYTCPPTYLFRENNECKRYMSTQETDLQVSSMIEGYCLGKGIPVPGGWLTYELMCELFAGDPNFFPLPPCPSEHNHMPEEDATVIAWHYAVCWGLAKGFYSKKTSSGL